MKLIDHNEMMSSSKKKKESSDKPIIIDSYQQGQELFVHLQLRIEDNGLGISEEGQKNLFIDFGKLSENGDRNKSGTGLGLSICKKIIEQMGGNVEVESKVGVGSAFIINIKTKCKFVQTQFVSDDDNLLSEAPSYNNFNSFKALVV